MDHWNEEHAAGAAGQPAQGDEAARQAAAAARADHIDDYPPDAPMPWDDDPPDMPRDAGLPRVRRDAFTPRRRNEFLRALAKTGCLADACRMTGAAPRTVYNHQQSDPEFLRLCNLAASMCATPVELTAWERGVTGVEEQFACGGKVYTRLKRSDHILKLLLQASNPKKYGARPGFKRKRMLKHEKKEIERQVRAEWASKQVASSEEVNRELQKSLSAYATRNATVRRQQGWTTTPDGHWIPTGYGLLAASRADERPAAQACEGGGGSGGDGDGGLGGLMGAERGREPPCESM